MRQRPGFSLLELLVSVTLLVSIFIIVVSSVASSLRENKARQAQITAIDNADRIVRSMVSLIRQAEPSATGAYPIAAASSTSFTFYTVTPNSAAIQQARLFLNGTNLQLGLTPPTGNPATYPAANEVVTTLLKNVQNGSTYLFRYYDKNYTGTQASLNTTTGALDQATIANVRLVKMTVIFDPDPVNPPGPSTIELLAQLRNLKDNY